MNCARLFRPRPTFGLRTLVVTIVAALSIGACEDEPTATESHVLNPQGSLPATPAPDLIDGDLPLFAQTTSIDPAFHIRQNGTGTTARFQQFNPSGFGTAVEAASFGTGPGLIAANHGIGTGAVILTSSFSNTNPALEVRSFGLGTAEVASALEIDAFNQDAIGPALNVSKLGTGTLLQVNHKGTSGDLAVFQVNGENQIRFDRSGQGIFNGGTKHKGADIAELFTVEGSANRYEPGDVLVISRRSDRTVEKSEGSYSTLVAGVYATRPGVVLTEAELDQTSENEVPLGVVGVIPTKVSAENGAIHRGDMLVTARRPGHAMRATDRSRMLGATIGKALEEFKGPGTGMIRVLVNVK